MVVWFIGKSASGKTFFGEKLYQRLKKKKDNIIFLDGDTLRQAISPELGHSKSDRYISEKRRSGLSKILSDQKINVIVAAISNEPEIREWNKKNINNYFEIYLKIDDKILRDRDPKSIYRNFDEGKIKNVVGEDIPFYVPSSPWMIIDANVNSEMIINKIANKLEKFLK